MTETDIKNLLVNFYDGNTTLEEEKILYEYFLYNKNIPSQFEPDKELFINLNRIGQSTPPENFENNIESFIDNLDNRKREKGKILNIGWKKIAGMAAAIVVLIASGISYTNYTTNHNEMQSIPTDKAYMEAERALLLLSHNLNKGTSQVYMAEKKVDKINEILSKQFQ